MSGERAPAAPDAAFALAEPVGSNVSAQPWLRSAPFDGVWILAPPVLVALLALVFEPELAAVGAVPPWAWVALVLSIDVAHVYSTLFRTYFDEEERARRRALFVAAPVFAFAGGVVLYDIGAGVFWRVLAYLAVFHFVRQQYGFFMLYRRREPPRATVEHRIDQAVIYLATLWPLAYWHANQPRAFSWLIEGDFFAASPAFVAVERVLLGAYVVAFVLYAAKELRTLRETRRLNVPKNVVLLGTAAAWTVGIVHCDSDAAFTLTNVVAHGVPYVALVWLRGPASPAGSPAAKRLRRWFSAPLLPAFLGLLLLLAYVEEGLWDGLVWREHAAVFPLFDWLPSLADSEWLTLVVPLLAVPQATHYILDGFIWRRSSRSDLPHANPSLDHV